MDDMETQYRKFREQIGSERVMVEDYDGVPISIPLKLTPAFQKRMEELRRRKEAGLPLLTPEEEAENAAQSKQALERLHKMLAES